MSEFEPAIAVVLAHEGGWVDDPDDPGGETNFGISSLIISREGLTSIDLGLDPVTAAQGGWLKAMTVDAAKNIYRRLFWDRYLYGRIEDQTCATKVFDAAVNLGPARAHQFAQFVAQCPVDGIFGPETCRAINACAPADFLEGFTAQLVGYYQGLVEAKPRLGKFLHNWLNRASWPKGH